MKYLTRKQARAYLRENGVTVSDGYLAQGARLGTGPRFRYLGLHRSTRKKISMPGSRLGRQEC